MSRLRPTPLLEADALGPLPPTWVAACLWPHRDPLQSDSPSHCVHALTYPPPNGVRILFKKIFVSSFLDIMLWCFKKIFF